MKFINFSNLKDGFKSHLYFLLLGCMICCNMDLQGQATLNIQGIIKKSSGANLDDGTYSMRFRLYTVATGSTHIWEEDHTNRVDVTSGVYNVVLGLITPFTISFDRSYFLGVSVDGGAEVSPRIRLTGAPYSLSLMGQKNIFPSTGTVGIGTVRPDTSARLHIKSDSDTTGRFMLEGKDTAVIVMKTRTDTASISFNGTKITIPDLSINYASGVSLPKGQSVKYNALSTWQLVQVDTLLDRGVWTCIEDWQRAISIHYEVKRTYGPFNSYIIWPNSKGANVLYRDINLGGIPHTMVKVVFTFHFFDTWDTNEFGFAAFGTESPYDGPEQTSGNFQVGWRQYAQTNFSTLFSNSGYFKGSSTLAASDYNIQGEMVAQTNANNIRLYFGSNLNDNSADETYGISNVQIWVR